MAARSSILAWRVPGTGEPGGLLSMGLHRVGHDWGDLAAAAAAAIQNKKFKKKKGEKTPKECQSQSPSSSHPNCLPSLVTINLFSTSVTLYIYNMYHIIHMMMYNQFCFSGWTWLMYTPSSSLVPCLSILLSWKNEKFSWIQHSLWLNINKYGVLKDIWGDGYIIGEK